MNEIYQIYDKTFKRILTLSGKAVINLINGLFDTDYPTDSIITYNWTEHEDTELKRTLADTILTINSCDSYHIEAQMTEDDEIVFRVFEYGFGHAFKHRITEKGKERIVFPKPCILYLDEGNKERIPDVYKMIVEFIGQQEVEYEVPVIKLQNITVNELNEKKMVILIPFLLLKLRKKLQKNRTKENMEELKELVFNDIIGSVQRNEKAGNISKTDAWNLEQLTKKLYEKIYASYKEAEDITLRLYDQSIELPSDKYEHTIEELEEMNAELEKQIGEWQLQKAEWEEQKKILERKNKELEEAFHSLEHRRPN